MLLEDKSIRSMLEEERGAGSWVWTRSLSRDRTSITTPPLKISSTPEDFPVIPTSESEIL
jgi:hypothetical protein